MRSVETKQGLYDGLCPVNTDSDSSRTSTGDGLCLPEQADIVLLDQGLRSVTNRPDSCLITA